MKIVIPTSGRADNQITLANLPEELEHRTYLAVNLDEYESYKKWRGFVAGIIVNKGPKGIGPTRQRIVEYFPNEKVMMLDDDLTFFRRRDDDPTKFKPAPTNSVLGMFEAVELLLNKDPHVGICSREGGNRRDPVVEYNTRTLRALAYNTKTLLEENISFEEVELMEDFHVSLSLLRKGYRTVLLCKWCQDQVVSNAPGGCSQYRSLELQAAAAHRLKELHPDYVTVVEKTTKTAWGGATRTDVRIQWKKAYESSKL